MTTSKILVFVLLLSVVFPLHAHVMLMAPVGGEVYTSSDIIEIIWQPVVNHGPNNWDVYVSTDGGDTWQPLALDLASNILSYNWVYPTVSSSQVRVKVVQDNDAGSRYEDSSENFSINSELPNSIFPESEETAEKLVAGFYPVPFSEELTVELNVLEPGQILIQLFDLTGRERIRILDDYLKIGYYQYSVAVEYLSEGLYLAKITTIDRTKLVKIIHL